MVGRSFVFINDGRTKKEKGRKKKRERPSGGRAALMCFIVEGDRSLETCMGRGRQYDIYDYYRRKLAAFFIEGKMNLTQPLYLPCNLMCFSLLLT